MKKLLQLLVLAACFAAFTPLQAQRYITDLFTDVSVTNDVMYAVNLTIVTGQPGPDTLYADIYEPVGDTVAERPVVIVSHTGSFLPVPLNGQATGAKNDTAVVQLCERLAKRGFVAVAMSYRMGWNPVGTQEERTGTLLNAAYRGIQDGFTLVRFLRSSIAGGNPYGLDGDKIVAGGMGTGGYISLGMASLDSYDEIELAKFINPGTQSSYVDTSLSGDIHGTWQRPLNLANHTSYSNEIHMAFNMGGAVGDSTWLEAGEVPIVSFHCPTDPFAPYTFGAVIVPTTGDFVVNVSGSHDVQRITNALGNNASYMAGTYNDPYTTAANAVNNGHDGLYPFYRPSPESAPWEYWDSVAWNIPHPEGGTFHTVGLQTNPDMSWAKSQAYIDTVVNYLTPRIACALGLEGCVMTASEEELSAGSVTVFPNPVQNELNVISGIAGNVIRNVSMMDLSGRVIMEEKGLNAMSWSFEPTQVSPGMYIVKVGTQKGTVTKKVIFE